MEESGLTGADLKVFRERLDLSSRGLAKAFGFANPDGSTVRIWESQNRVLPVYVQTIIEMVEAVPEAREWFLSRTKPARRRKPKLLAPRPRRRKRKAKLTEGAVAT